MYLARLILHGKNQVFLRDALQKRAILDYVKTFMHFCVKAYEYSKSHFAVDDSGICENIS